MGSIPVNSSEAFVFDICRRSFLSLWCYNNPRAKPGKELCDILVVCEPHIVVISVKDVRLKGDDQASHERWERKAVDDSVRQIHGAVRWLASATQVTRSDGTPGLPLPPPGQRIVHRIAVAFGGQNEVTITSGDDGNGYVHVMTERSFHTVLTELDTITDFVEYLAAKETCSAKIRAMIIEGSEANLLGLYIFNGRAFPASDMMVVGDYIWEEISNKPEFTKRKEADRPSYIWDHIIESLGDPNAKPFGEAGADLTQFEQALRVMAKENRFNRRYLGPAVREFVEDAKAGKTAARILSSPSGVVYVVVYFRQEVYVQSHGPLMVSRCITARHHLGRGDLVVGIGIGEHRPDFGSPLTLVLMKCPNWSAKEDAAAAELMERLGFFKSPISRHVQQDEFPS